MLQYKIQLESQLGSREGILKIEEQNHLLLGTITLLGFENPASGKWTGPNTFRLSHHLQTLFSSLPCESTFEIENDTITGILYHNQNRMKWHGIREMEKKGDETENG